MMDFKLKQPGNVGVLTIVESLTIESSTEFKDALLNSFSETDDLVLDFRDVTEVDLSCLQLICAANNMAAKLNKRLVVSEGPEGILKKAVIESGYSRLLPQYSGFPDNENNGGVVCP